MNLSFCFCICIVFYYLLVNNIVYDCVFFFLNTFYCTDDVAQLISPSIIVGSNPDKCKLRVHYHLYGDNVRNLIFYTRTQIGGPLTQVRIIGGNKGSMWERLEVNLYGEPGVPFEVK